MAEVNLDVAMESSVQKVLEQATAANTNASGAFTHAYNADTHAYNAYSNTATNNTPSATGNLSQKLSHIIKQNDERKSDTETIRDLKFSEVLTEKVAGNYNAFSITGKGVIRAIRYYAYVTTGKTCGITINVDGVTYNFRFTYTGNSSGGMTFVIASYKDISNIDDSGRAKFFGGILSEVVSSSKLRGFTSLTENYTASSDNRCILLENEGIPFNSSFSITGLNPIDQASTTNVVYTLL